MGTGVEKEENKKAKDKGKKREETEPGDREITWRY